MILMRLLILIDESQDQPDYQKGLKDALKIIKEETGSR